MICTFWLEYGWKRRYFALFLTGNGKGFLNYDSPLHPLPTVASYLNMQSTLLIRSRIKGGQCFYKRFLFPLDVMHRFNTNSSQNIQSTIKRMCLS